MPTHLALFKLGEIKLHTVTIRRHRIDPNRRWSQDTTSTPLFNVKMSSLDSHTYTNDQAKAVFALNNEKPKSSTFLTFERLSELESMPYSRVCLQSIQDMTRCPLIEDMAEFAKIRTEYVPLNWALKSNNRRCSSNCSPKRNWLGRLAQSGLKPIHAVYITIK